eukprot:Blabericola_migrator_1__8735@NODE_45_length_16846_cov_82_345015_g41_i0_p10_GENE_NODE_45_length_16846_cov_82_345015_g41_i0NODE_45_length_16846_cov_82_345015_g41_i0_p10_ORF_typecomplete_len186_score5_13Fringe/PF02434_16/0_093_NODE_45_length_16846_cov_82_345015_g41_i091909747
MMVILHLHMWWSVHHLLSEGVLLLWLGGLGRSHTNTAWKFDYGLRGRSRNTLLGTLLDYERTRHINSWLRIYWFDVNRLDLLSRPTTVSHRLRNDYLRSVKTNYVLYSRSDFLLLDNRFEICLRLLLDMSNLRLWIRNCLNDCFLILHNLRRGLHSPSPNNLSPAYLGQRIGKSLLRHSLSLHCD